MVSKNQSVSPVAPYEVTQALVALKLGDSDEAVLRFFNSLSGKIPVTASYFLHVIARFDLMDSLFEKEPKNFTDSFIIDDEIIGRMEEKVRSMFPVRTNMYVEYDLREGDPLEELLKEAEDLKADLVLVGQSKNEDHGILAKNLARQNPVNTLVIPEGAKTRIESILVPIDFSDYSAKALKTALGIYDKLPEGTRIKCMYAYKIPDMVSMRMDRSWVQFRETVEKNIKDGFEAFVHTNAPDFADKVELAMVYREHQDPATQIMEFAEKENVDLMVMGAKGHSKVHRLLIGSVTEKVLDMNKKIPTLIVK